MDREVPSQHQGGVPDAGSVTLSKTGTGQGVAPVYLDPTATMEIVQRYVEEERGRTRRILFWASTLFVACALVILVLFISIGIYVINNAKHAADIANDALDNVAQQGIEMVDISNKLAHVEGRTAQVRQMMDDEQRTRAARNRLLKEDLERFRHFVEDNDSKSLTALASMQDHLSALQKSLADREQELQAIRRTPAGPPSGPVLMPGPVATGAVRAVAAATGPVEPRGGRMATPGTEQAEPPAPRPAMMKTTPEQLFAEAIADTAEEPKPGEVRRPVSLVTYPDGDSYRGEFRNGLFDGWGIYTFKNEDRYEGEFKDNMKSGRGTYVFANGDRYVGPFKDDMKEGKGTLLFSNGDKFKGDFRRDTISGKGTMIYANGNKYAGDFLGGLKHGNGVFLFANNDRYEGEFREDLRNGRGTYAFSNGEKYIGDFVNGLRQGQGRYVYNGGEEYIGEWKNGKKDGKGVCVYPNGEQVAVTWKDDALVEESTPPQPTP